MFQANAAVQDNMRTLDDSVQRNKYMRSIEAAVKMHIIKLPEDAEKIKDKLYFIKGFSHDVGFLCLALENAEIEYRNENGGHFAEACKKYADFIRERYLAPRLASA